MGPNDSHIGKDGSLQPGLGKDELTPEQRAAMNTRSGQALAKMKEELQALGAEVTEKEKANIEHERKLLALQSEIAAERERLAEQAEKLARREAAVNESALAAVTGGGDDDETDE